jgi:L-alanine-DL-glutamate epimerase-like enolase superfamily enzyme
MSFATTMDSAAHERLKDLPVEIDAYELEPLSQQTSSAFTRRTTVIRLLGSGEDGVGEDVTPPVGVDERLPHELSLSGSWTLEAFSAQLDTLELFATPPFHPALLSFRRWAFESAGLDLALRQAGRSLADVLGREPRPVRFVNSLRLPDPPAIDPIPQRRAIYPELQFKLDPTSDWTDELIARLAATNAVVTLDLKGQYPPDAPIAQPADPVLYERVATAFADALIEDPAITPETVAFLRDHADRISWDALVCSVASIDQLPFAPHALNIKPARIGTIRTLFEIYDHCERHGIPTYGGGMMELGPGRGQIQYLASLFSPDAPNDVAPREYNLPDPPPALPRSPLPPHASVIGFR